MSESELGRLHDLALFLRAEENLGTHLGELLKRAASVTDAASCSIMLLSEGEANAPRLKLWGSTETLPSSALSERPGRGDSIAGWVLAQGTSLLIADIEQSKFAPMARNRSNMGTSFICTPIAVKNHVIGVMNLSSRPDHPSFNESHLVLADIVATLIGKSVQVERLQTLIRSRVAQLSLAREGKEVSARLTDGTLAPARVAKLLAKSFFKDMAAAGFEPGQIIEAASEIITLVSTDIARFKKRMTRTTK
ncbi:MAG: GAF domain-containing protein [Betaproteobacteria bacterium]|nr:MAG: GAF domain-containing protein [Betaproteobacteria bacterium]